jgi:polysaccharide biosynthesis/export protein
MKCFVIIGAALLALPLTGCATAPAPQADISANAKAPYRLDTGDEVRVSIYGIEPASAAYPVSPEGTISLPLLPAIPVAGKSIPEVEAAIGQALLARDVVKNAVVSVAIVKYRPFFILGEVRSPGQYAYVPGMTVLNAVSIAGGYTFRAKKNKVTIVRRTANGTVKTGGGPETLVMPSDSIQVDESWF